MEEQDNDAEPVNTPTVSTRNSKISNKDLIEESSQKSAKKITLPPLKKNRGQPKQGPKSIDSNKNDKTRVDRLGNEISKGNKFRVTFVDQVTNKRLITVHMVQSYKKYNLLVAREKTTYCSCTIF